MRTQLYTTVVFIPVRIILYQEALAGRSTNDLWPYILYILYVPSWYPVVYYDTVHTCTYCTVQYQEALAGRSTDDLYMAGFTGRLHIVGIRKPSSLKI